MQLLGLWQSSMVLQRNCVNTLYCKSESAVTVEFCEKTLYSTETSNGFCISLHSMPAGGPYKMLVKNENEQILLTDIYIGDVWLLGGQSNMELPIRRTLDVTQSDICKPRNSQIKAFLQSQVHLPNEQPNTTVLGQWISADSDNILDFSAVGYYFAKQISQKYDIPVGIIQTAQGGTTIECWLSLQQLKLQNYEFLPDTNEQELEQIYAENQREIEVWQNELLKKDKGICEQWQINKPQTQTVIMPQMFETIFKNDFCAAIWLFKTFNLQSVPSGDAKLVLGAIADGDKTYINGKLVGETTYRYPPRKYTVPPNVLKKGINTITVRVEVSQGHGGFTKGKKYAFESETQQIDLSGEWQIAIGAKCESAPKQIFPQRYPSRLYNGMIYPLRNTKICGVAFYQGESNSDNPKNYCEKFLAVVESWRSLFQNPSLPFLFVQLANYDDPFVSGGFAKIRLQQLKAAKLLQNGGMAVSIDVGEDNDLHPQDKITVAKRLFNLSQKYAYGEDINPDAPYAQTAQQDGFKIIISFKNAQRLYIKNGDTTVYVNYKNGEKLQHSAVAINNTLVINGANLNAQSVEYLNQDAPKTNIVYNENEHPCSAFVCIIQAN